MDVVDLLTEAGGVARRKALLAYVERKDLELAVATGAVLRDARGLYTLPALDDAVRVAHRLTGILCLTSAALHHGWAVKTVPDRPHVVLSRGRRLPADPRAHVHRLDLLASEIDGIATAQHVTMAHCLRSLPFDEALAVADSALRDGYGAESLRRQAEKARGPGSRQFRRVAGHASVDAANPFETALRAISIDVPGLSVVPQVDIREGGFAARPDLVDESLGIVLEADSFEWHGGRSALASDAHRYNQLVVLGWIVLRFSYEQVMFRPDEVREILVAAVALAGGMSERRRARGDAA